jgi:hypothetical protein
MRIVVGVGRAARLKGGVFLGSSRIRGQACWVGATMRLNGVVFRGSSINTVVCVAEHEAERQTGAFDAAASAGWTVTTMIAVEQKS